MKQELLDEILKILGSPNKPVLVHFTDIETLKKTMSQKDMIDYVSKSGKVLPKLKDFPVINVATSDGKGERLKIFNKSLLTEEQENKILKWYEESKGKLEELRLAYKPKPETGTESS